MLAQDEPPLEVEVGSAMTQAEAGGLQPDTEYSVRVAALVRDSRGQLSAPDAVRTRGGVPQRGRLHARFLPHRAPPHHGAAHPTAGPPLAPPLEVTWLLPPQSPGPVIGYRLLYGLAGDPHPPRQVLKNAADQRAVLDDLGEWGARIQHETRPGKKTTKII